MSGTYEVTWSNVYEDSESPEDAVAQALGDLGHVLKHHSGPSIFVVRDGEGNRVATIDIEFEQVSEVPR